MVIDDALTNSQANAGARHISSMQAFKHAEDPLVIFRRNSNPVIFDRKYPVVVSPLRLDMDLQISFFGTVL
jgi:hypothetical protein